MTESLKSTIDRFKRAEVRLKNLLAEPGGAPEFSLVELDEILDTSFNEILDLTLTEKAQCLVRIRFLISRLAELSSIGGISKAILDQIERDISSLETFYTRQEVKLATSDGIATENDDQLIEMCFVSQATRQLTNEDVFNLRTRITPFNAKHGVTGVLAYDDKTNQFMQVMECASHTQDALIERIQTCSLHCHIEMVSHSLIEARTYENWTLRLLKTQEIREIFSTNEPFSNWFNRQLGLNSAVAQSNGHKWLVSSLSQLVA